MEDDLAPYHGSHFKHTAPPVPSWSFGDGLDSSEQGKKWLAGEESGWTGFDASKEAPGYVCSTIYFLCVDKALQVYRANLVTTPF